MNQLNQHLRNKEIELRDILLRHLRKATGKLNLTDQAFDIAVDPGGLRVVFKKNSHYDVAKAGVAVALEFLNKNSQAGPDEMAFKTNVDVEVGKRKTIVIIKCPLSLLAECLNTDTFSENLKKLFANNYHDLGPGGGRGA